MYRHEVTSNQPFRTLNGSLFEYTMRAIDEMGFVDMTEIQAQCIPKLLQGIDLRGTAKTGSGKTLAFLIPAIELMARLKYAPGHGTGTIVISPTRELAMQTFEVLKRLIKYHPQTVGIVTGGTNMHVEMQKLREGVNILVATPGRLLDHLMNTEGFITKNLTCLVIDEADRIFDSGFEKAMKQIINYLPERRQTILFSATKDDKTDAFATLALKSKLFEVNVDAGKPKVTCEGLEEAFVVCAAEKKFLTLYAFLASNINRKVMVFFSSCHCVKYYDELLRRLSINVLCIYGRLSQTKRTNSFYEFSNATSGVLLCTDVAARGWDVPSVDWIVQYDPPIDPKEYIHRVGRTARAGGVGNAVLFLTEQEMNFIEYLKFQKVNLRPMAIPRSSDDYYQQQLENLLAADSNLRQSATIAFAAFLRSYKTHSLKKCFNMTNINVHGVAKSFGLKTPPYISSEVTEILKMKQMRSNVQNKRKFWEGGPGQNQQKWGGGPGQMQRKKPWTGGPGQVKNKKPWTGPPGQMQNKKKFWGAKGKKT